MTPAPGDTYRKIGWLTGEVKDLRVLAVAHLPSGKAHRVVFVDHHGDIVMFSADAFERHVKDGRTFVGSRFTQPWTTP